MFSKVDIYSAYHQLIIGAKDVQKTALQTHYRHYEFLIISFELTNASVTFMHLITQVLLS